MKQQLAVEWFAKRISHGGLVTKKQFDELLEQAKEMEKEQRGYSEEDVRNAINLVKKYDEWSIEHGESFFAYIEDQIIQQLKLKQQEQ
jgi:hypothetical protein